MIGFGHGLGLGHVRNAAIAYGVFLTALLLFINYFYQKRFIMQLQEEMTIIREVETFYDLIHSINGPYHSLAPTATRFYFVRHGESKGNKEKIYCGQTLDVDLTEKGEKDAIQAGQKLKALKDKEGWDFDYIFSSPSLRAKRTTEIALSLVNEPHLDRRLIEKHIGIFDGKPMDDAYTQRTFTWEAQIEKQGSFSEKFNIKHDPTDIQEESLQQVFDRVAEFLIEKNSCEFHGKHVFVGSHGGVLKVLLMALAAYHHAVILEYHRVEAPNGALLIVEVDKGRIKIVKTDGFVFREKSKHQETSRLSLTQKYP